MQKSEKKFLYLVFLGGRAVKANIELHDVRWVVGTRIQDTYDILRRDWFGSIEGLHIDSYKKIKNVDGYKVNVKNIEKKKLKNNKFFSSNTTNKNLWFVNIGGYDPSSMQEKHEFGLVVASSSTEAVNKAKNKWLMGCKKKHKDEIYYLKHLITLDDCELIKKIDDWEIELKQDNSFIDDTNCPDWYGYRRIDMI